MSTAKFVPSLSIPGRMDIMAGSIIEYASIFGKILIASTAMTSTIGLISIPIGAS